MAAGSAEEEGGGHTMTTHDDATLAALEAKARAATPGPWQSWRPPDDIRDDGSISEVRSRAQVPVCSWSGFDDSNRPKRQHRRNADYIAAVNPQTILALVADLRAAEAANTALRTALEETQKSLRFVVLMVRLNPSGPFAIQATAAALAEASAMSDGGERLHEIIDLWVRENEAAAREALKEGTDG